MGGWALVRGKRRTVRIDAGTLQKIAGVLGIKPSDQVTAISLAVSSRPEAAARSRRRGRAKRSTRRAGRKKR